jgi:HD-like signal output (HDOD) protein
MATEVDEFINKLLGDLRRNDLRLPTLPQVALKITDTIENPNSTAKDVTRVVATDAALSARLIQVANSALYRSATRVEDVQMAVTRLGMKQVRNIATSLLIRQLFHTKYEGLKKRLEKLWSHSAHVAAISAVLARKHTKLKPDEAMLAGLIHDIGELPILAYAEQFPAIAASETTLDEITEKIGPALGKAMLQVWKFAPPMITVVAEHENLARNAPGEPDYCDVVLVANLHSYLGTQHRLGRANWADVPALKKLGLSPEESINTMKEAREDVLEMQRLLTG